MGDEEVTSTRKLEVTIGFQRQQTLFSHGMRKIEFFEWKHRLRAKNFHSGVTSATALRLILDTNREKLKFEDWNPEKLKWRLGCTVYFSY